jgi:endonuclease/exonuclease/phosphatase family metal-dependent hydrolase
VRLLTYNVHGLRDDDEALARVIRSAAPDVVCVQEAPNVVRWRSRCARLARISGLVVAAGGRPAAGNVILTSLRIDVSATAEVLFSKQIGRFQRGVAIAVLRLGEADFAVAGTHLDLHAAGRLRHVAELSAVLAAHVPGPVAVIVAGDINDQPGSSTWQAIAAGRVDAGASADAAGRAGTYPASGPRRTIDGVFVDPRFRVRSASVLGGADVAAASDHRPVLVELELPAGKLGGPGAT